MGATLVGSLLLASLVLAGVRRWISLPLALFLAAAWLSALGWLPDGAVPFGAMVALAEVTLWTELGWLVLGSRGPAEPGMRDPALSGFVGGVVGGAGLWFVGRVPGLPLALGFAGGVAACMVRGSGPGRALTATVLLPVGQDRTNGLVPTIFFLSVALGAVPR